MEFRDRLNQADALVKIVDNHIWEPLSERISIVPFGYETHIPDAIRKQMRFLRTVTSRFIRFTPDYFVLDKEYLKKIYLLEYKTTQTPIYSKSRISMIGRAGGVPCIDWKDIGQMEADAYDNYMAMQSLGVKVAVLNYCAYHSLVLLCDYIENIQLLHRDKVTTVTQTGSRTPFVNFNCKSMRILHKFIQDEHGIDVGTQTHMAACEELQRQLPVKHHRNSPYS